jgi:hypothetical protein
MNEDDDATLAMFVAEGLHIADDEFRPVAIAGVIAAGGDKVTVGEWSFDVAEARAVAASILAAADAVDAEHREVLR